MKKVVLTGVSGQVGRSFLKTLLANGYCVFGVDLEKKIDFEAENFEFVSLDITSETQVVSFFQSLPDIYGLVNNAGIGVFSPFEDRTVEDFSRVMSVNLLGTFLMCREAIKKMKRFGAGKIVNIGSIYGQVSSDPRIYGDSGRLNSEVYSMTKAGVIMLSKYLSAHYANLGIQVNTLSPGGVYRSQTADFVENYESKTPAHRMATTEDLQATLLYLLDEKNSYVNGQNITIDGGFTSW